ncbi:hypothetical protein EVA_17996 [gut metagenome]|uniref:Uncharacterized protein n=1 Tax=gut metagenome TaxID=749906 RepID=J9FHI0_9ZZZZ
MLWCCRRGLRFLPTANSWRRWVCRLMSRRSRASLSAVRAPSPRTSTPMPLFPQTACCAARR